MFDGLLTSGLLKTFSVKGHGMAIQLNTSLKLISVVALSTTFAVNAYAGDAAKVLLKSGDAVIVHADNSETPANKETIVAEGDTIETRKGRVQVVTVDGAKITLLPQTVFKFNRYAFNGSEDGAEYAHTELVRGGLRTLAGHVGNKNADRYQMKTPVAIIHANGGEFSVQYKDKLSLTTNQGKVNVCNAGGCRQVLAGQSVNANSTQSQASYSQDSIKLTMAPSPVEKTAWTQEGNAIKKANVASLD